MNYSVLKTEVTLADYAGMSDDAISVALNAQTLDAVQDVATSDARALLLATGEWGAVVLLARSTPSDTIPVQAVAAAITAEDTLRLTATLEISKPGNWVAVQTLVATLQAAGVLSTETGAALLALRQGKTSRAAQLGLGEVQPGDVAMARIFSA